MCEQLAEKQVTLSNTVPKQAHDPPPPNTDVILALSLQQSSMYTVRIELDRSFRSFSKVPTCEKVVPFVSCHVTICPSPFITMKRLSYCCIHFPSSLRNEAIPAIHQKIQNQNHLHFSSLVNFSLSLPSFLTITILLHLSLRITDTQSPLSAAWEDPKHDPMDSDGFLVRRSEL